MNNSFDEALICRHYYISGRVQGVWYRSWSQKTAQKLGLTGWTKNLSDKRVEIMACGTEAQLAQYETLLKKGPTLARVSEIQAETCPFQTFETFEIAD